MGELRAFRVLDVLVSTDMHIDGFGIPIRPGSLLLLNDDEAARLSWTPRDKGAEEVPFGTPIEPFQSPANGNKSGKCGGG